VTEEYRTIATLHAAGVPVPRPVLVEDAADGRHPAFAVVDWVDGQPIGGVPAFRDAALCRRLAEILAAIHAAPAERFPHLPGSNSTIPEQQLTDLRIREREWRDSGAVNPIVEYALHWLRANVAASDGPRCLVHGDYRPHNVLGVGREVTAVVDWEHTRIGTAAEDLAYFRPPPRPCRRGTTS
jgi:aminoglycoside phosphotransferase (APT) family kinase protein